MSTLATRFTRQRAELRSEMPLTDDQIRTVAPSIFAEHPHAKCSARYAYIPTSMVLSGLRREGFEPFMVAQTRARDEDRREHTKHMVRLRHRSSGLQAQEADEIILINSHDGTSRYQMLAGKFRFVCCNGLVVGEQLADIRIPHRGDVTDRVIEGAYSVLGEFDRVSDAVEEMKGTNLSAPAQIAFGRSALALRYDEGKAPITEHAAIRPRRADDTGNDLWSTFNRVQENLIRGGVRGAIESRRVRTRAVTGIDQNVRLNRSLWMLAEAMNRMVRAH